jgi:hypothetical protein
VRRREVPGTGDSGPYFFLSYRHTPKFVEHDETDPDIWAAKLYRDLCAHLFQMSSLPVADSMGFMDRELRPGHEWTVKLASALASCRVFVPLYSPRYFSSEHCGREWSAFAGRAAAMSVRGAEPVEAIIPALWVPVRPDELPEAARTIHYLAGDFGGAYATHGFYRLMRMSNYADDYEEAVYALARRILDVPSALRSPLVRWPTTTRLSTPSPRRAGRRGKIVGIAASWCPSAGMSRGRCRFPSPGTGPRGTWSSPAGSSCLRASAIGSLPTVMRRRARSCCTGLAVDVSGGEAGRVSAGRGARPIPPAGRAVGPWPALPWPA